MFSTLARNFRVFAAEQFRESVSEAANTKLYFTYGRIHAWANDAAPNATNTFTVTSYDVWRNMIGGKRVTGNDMRHVIPRYNWANNTLYDTYHHNRNLYMDNVRFYVVTADWNVYKCLSNNNGANSIVKPTSVSTSPVQTADGYIWKYMYTVSAAEQLNYTTYSYMPVKTLTADDNSLQFRVQDEAIPGALHTIHILNGGENYTNANLIYLTITGDGSGANAFVRTNASNMISEVVVDDVGQNYTFANVVINQTSGSGANGSLEAIISPVGGHGSDPLRELGGNYLMINMQLRGDESGKFPVVNDFRQVALLQEPFIKDTENVVSNSTFSQFTTLTLNGTSVDYISDEDVYQGSTLASATFRGKVLQWDSPNSLIKLVNTIGSPSAELLTGSQSLAARFVSSITNPELEAYTGEVLYVEHTLPFERDLDQTEDFKIVIRF